MKSIEATRIRIEKTPLIEQLGWGGVSRLGRYRAKSLGKGGLIPLLEYEFANIFLSDLSGAPGYILRKWFYRRLFKKLGGGVIFGRGITLRHPRLISMGQNVAIDEYVLLDASGAGEDGMTIGDGVIISRNCVVQGKSGPVSIGKNTDIGVNTVITSAGGIFLEDSVLIAGNCYLGGARYITERLDSPIMEQGIYSKGPVVIGEGTWLGAGVIVLDGVRVGKGCAVGAGAVVVRDLPDYAVAAGVPAQILRSRNVDAPPEKKEPT